MQSSLTSVLPSASDYSSSLPVSVVVRSRCLTCQAFLGHLSSDIQIKSLLPLRAGTFPIVPSPSKCRPSTQYTSWRRNVDLLSIVYAFRPRLRYRLTLGGIAFPRKPQAIGGQDSHLPYRYSFRHYHLSSPTSLLTVRLVSRRQRSPTNVSIPSLRCHAYSRSLSAQNCSTSKLLRTF